MAVNADVIGFLSGVDKLDEKYIGGKPRSQHGVKHPRGKGTKVRMRQSVVCVQIEHE